MIYRSITRKSVWKASQKFDSNRWHMSVAMALKQVSLRALRRQFIRDVKSYSIGSHKYRVRWIFNFFSHWLRNLVDQFLHPVESSKFLFISRTKIAVASAEYVRKAWRRWHSEWFNPVRQQQKGVGNVGKTNWAGARDRRGKENVFPLIRTLWNTN